MTTLHTDPAADRRLPSLAPSRWLLVGDSAWRDALQQSLDDSPNPMLRWRRDHGLAELLPPTHLERALREALLSGTTQVHVLAQPEHAVDATRLLSSLLDRRPGVDGHASPAQPPFAPLLQALTQPDGLAWARWLSGPRHRRLVQVYTTEADTPMHRQADAALAEWLEGFLDGADDDLLDAIYGPIDLQSLDNQPGIGEHALSPGLRRATEPALHHAADGPLLFAAAAAAAGSASIPAPPAWHRDGRVEGDLPPPDEGLTGGATGGVGGSFCLQWPIDTATGRPVRLPSTRVTLRLELDAGAWASHRPRLMLVQPADGGDALLVPLPGETTPPAHGPWVFEAALEMDRETFASCDDAAAEFRLLAEARR